MRKTLATAALCAAALTPLLAQPAFATPLTPAPAPSATATAATESETPDPTTTSGVGTLALVTPESPSFIQGAPGNTQIRFTSPTTGKLRITAPTGTLISLVQFPGCTLSADRTTAECGDDATVWNAPLALTLASDGITAPGTSTDGRIEVRVGETVVSSVSLGATVRPNLTASSPTIKPGETGSITLTFALPTSGQLTLAAPLNTSITAVSDPRCEILPQQTAITCPAPARWSAPVTVSIRVNAEVPTGTVLDRGSARVSNTLGAAITSAGFQVIAGDTLEDLTITKNRNALSGTGLPGATVRVHDANNALVASSAVAADGTWALNVPYPGRGNHSFEVTQTLGTDSSTPATVTIDFGEGLAITSPTPGGTLNGTPATFTGTGTVGATVTVAGTSRTVCTTVVTADGIWSCDASFDLPLGYFTLTARQTGTVTSSATVNFVRQSASNAANVAITSPANNGTVNTLRPIFRGTGEPGAAIRVFGTSRNVGTATVKADGTWEVPAGFDLRGKFVLNIEQTPTNGAARSYAAVTFTTVAAR
ncbi:Ig-like domain-containing protein [Mycetocola sp. JXN-3]|uniref:Ig-like domain-containing protein n=1 Tax=Mycetocola sp. JXN-3 TaxID=2116510 RepID=UPI00165CEFD0|nr:Ig-like domain-containing protein [Mycetocola sp. JXN-3]